MTALVCFVNVLREIHPTRIIFEWVVLSGSNGRSRFEQSKMMVRR
jgi:hypothetical protein